MRELLIGWTVAGIFIAIIGIAIVEGHNSDIDRFCNQNDMVRDETVSDGCIDNDGNKYDIKAQRGYKLVPRK